VAALSASVDDDRHSALNQDEYSMSGWWCLFRPDRESSEVCPPYSALVGAGLADVPSHVCAIQRVRIAEKKALQNIRARSDG
jgi:hypothetical protein